MQLYHEKLRKRKHKEVTSYSQYNFKKIYIYHFYAHHLKHWVGMNGIS